MIDLGMLSARIRGSLADARGVWINPTHHQHFFSRAFAGGSQGVAVRHTHHRLGVNPPCHLSHSPKKSVFFKRGRARNKAMTLLTSHPIRWTTSPDFSRSVLASSSKRGKN